jgi:hypothetical protein
MTESDEWATVETVVDEELDSNHHETIHKQGPSGIEQGILEKSRLTCMVSLFSNITKAKLYYCYYIFLQFFSSSVIPIHGYFFLLWLVFITLCRSFGFLLKGPAQMNIQLLVRIKLLD